MDNFQPIDESEYRRLMDILNANSNKSFVKRILNPSAYPSLDLGEGRVATHRMEWAEANGKYYAYPTVLLDPTGKLKDWGDKAFDEVMRSGNYIEFDTPQDASWFSRNYKGAWGGQMNKPPR